MSINELLKELKDREFKLMKVNIDDLTGMNNALKWMLDFMDDDNLKNDHQSNPFQVGELEPKPLPY